MLDRIVGRDVISDSKFKAGPFSKRSKRSIKRSPSFEDKGAAPLLWPVGVALQVPSSFKWIQRDAIWLMLMVKMFMLLAKTYPAQPSIALMFEEGIKDNAYKSMSGRISDEAECVLDVVDRQVALVRMAVVRPAVFGAAVGQDAGERDGVLFEEGEHAVVEEVGRRDRRLLRVQLGGRALRVGVDKRLLVNPAHALEGADVEGVLAPQ